MEKPTGGFVVVGAEVAVCKAVAKTMTDANTFAITFEGKVRMQFPLGIAVI